MPKHAPASREQWKDWNQVWPTSWRKPELTAVTAATAAARAVTAAEEHQMHIWMNRAYALAEANADSGNVCNAAVIVDPVSGEVCHYITSRCPILCYVTFQGCTLIVNLLCYIDVLYDCITMLHYMGVCLLPIWEGQLGVTHCT